MVAAELQYLREEEKLARDVYITLGKQWNLQIFGNIASSEQRHMDVVAGLLAQRGIEDPVQSDDVGAFTNPQLASLYQELTATGARSEMDALLVGASIEELDIKDLRLTVSKLGDGADKDTLDRLTCASRNHLRAFTRQISSRGGSFAPQHITGELYGEIINGPHERCGQIGGHACGSSPGKGRGNKGRGAGHGSAGQGDCQCGHDHED